MKISYLFPFVILLISLSGCSSSESTDAGTTPVDSLKVNTGFDSNGVYKGDPVTGPFEIALSDGEEETSKNHLYLSTGVDVYKNAAVKFIQTAILPETVKNDNVQLTSITSGVQTLKSCYQGNLLRLMLLRGATKFCNTAVDGSYLFLPTIKNGVQKLTLTFISSNPLSVQKLDNDKWVDVTSIPAQTSYATKDIDINVSGDVQIRLANLSTTFVYLFYLKAINY